MAVSAARARASSRARRCRVTCGARCSHATPHSPSGSSTTSSAACASSSSATCAPGASSRWWHAFILDTRAYGRFCARAFGRFLHHSQAQTLGRDARRNDGLRRTWFHACRLEGIDPRAPAALPLLFALDAALAIPGGFVYQPDCGLIQAAAASGVHCGTSFSDGAVAGDAASFGGEDGSGGGGGADGDGGGDGGGGCGGGD